MKLDVWLEKKPPTADRLRAIASLCGAIADSHKRGTVLGGMAPSQIEVAADGGARLEAGGLGPGSPYAAPELAQGGAPAPKSDIYSAGAVFYEILAGKPPFQSDPPRPLQEARPDLSQDLTDAVSACMERDPEWRPADLSYLQAVVQQLQKNVTPGRIERARNTAAARASGAPSALLDAAPPRRRHDDRSPLTRALPLILVLVAIAGTAAAWFWYDVIKPGGSAPVAARVAPSPPGAPRVADAPASEPPAPATETSDLTPAAPGAPTPSAAATPSVTKGSPGASPVPTAVPSAARAVPATLPAALPTAAPEPKPEPSAAAATPEPAPAATLAPPAPDEDTGPALVRAVAPFRLRAGSLQVLDVHGSGLRADHRAKIVPLRKREAAAGFTVTRYQLRDSGLLLVFVQVDGAVRPGKYGLSLVDSAGAETNAFTIEVVK